MRRKDDESMERYEEEEYERRIEERMSASNSGRVKHKTAKSAGAKAQERERGQKAPLLLRVFAWMGVIMLCIVAGYIGTSYMLKLLEKQSLLKPDDRIQTQEELSAFLSADNPVDASEVKLDMQKASISLFYPKDGVLVEEKNEIIVRTREDDIQDALVRLMNLSGLFPKDMTVQHVFRNVDTVYLDFPSTFASALTSAGNRTSALFITGIVRTMRDNFPPITKVRFLVDSQVKTAGAPVDLTATWQLPK